MSQCHGHHRFRRQKQVEGSKKRNICREISEIITGSSYRQKIKNKHGYKTTKSQERLKTGAAKVHKSDSCRRKPRRDEGDRSSMTEKFEDDDHTFCLYCGERYEDTKGEEWIVCTEYQQRVQEDCTDNEPGQDNFMCNSCR
jgi:hypothetical protein